MAERILIFSGRENNNGKHNVVLRVQNEQFSEKKGLILRDTENEVSAVIRIPDPRITGELSTATICDWLMNGHKSSVRYINSANYLVYKSIRCTQLSQNNKL